MQKFETRIIWFESSHNDCLSVLFLNKHDIIFLLYCHDSTDPSTFKFKKIIIKKQKLETKVIGESKKIIQGATSTQLPLYGFENFILPGAH